MPIHPAHKDKKATDAMVAALILQAWATLRLYRSIKPEALVAEWQKIIDELPSDD